MKYATRRQAGFSIVELLVAMAVGLILMTGVLRIFLGNTESYSINQNLARLQENGRFTLEFITREINSAGYYGCFSDGASLQTALNSPTAFLYDFSQPIDGFESTGATTWSPGVDGSISGSATPPLGGSDILTIRRIDPDLTMRISTDMTNSGTNVVLASVPAASDRVATGA